MSLEWKIDMPGFVYLKSPYGIKVECELGGTETEQRNQLGKQSFLIKKKKSWLQRIMRCTGTMAKENWEAS